MGMSKAWFVSALILTLALTPYARPAGSQGESCTSNGGCGSGDFCEFPAGQCDLSNVAGTCVSPPDSGSCPLVFDPACGCDGITYPNDCSRLAAGVSLDHAGTCEPLEVTIDIRPGSFPDRIAPGTGGVIRVAILTTPTFDATTVNPATVLFGATGTEAAPLRSFRADVDGDGDTDLVLHFNARSTGITCGVTSASLSGETFDGQPITGVDSIQTVGCK